jgi:multidrug efflux pump subunit AcrA (membrane-fusion protein)
MFARIINWYGKKVVFGTIAVAVLLLVVGVQLKDSAPEVAVVEEALPKVQVGSLASLSATESISVLGTVRSISEVNVSPERGGNVVRVNSRLGDTVSAGQVIIELENASERAALIQAEGSYEAAVAGAEQSGISITQAENILVSALNGASNANRSAFSAVNSVLTGTIDTFFSNPITGLVGLKVSGSASTLNNERVELRNIISNWQDSSKVQLSESNVLSILDKSIADTKKVQNLVEQFVNITAQAKSSDVLDGRPVTSFNAELQGAQSNINGVVSSLQNAKTAYTNALNAREQAQVGGSGSDSSLSAAQVKIALGSLRAAQANYQKTLLRTPISGTVNALDVKVGQLLNAGSPVFTVANNNQLEVVAFVSDKEKSVINIGDAVSLGSNSSGTIIAISEAINNATGKFEVRIVTTDSNLTNGDSVYVKKEVTNTVVNTDISVPLTAVKFSGENASMFEVKDNKLSIIDVNLGEVRGAFVKVLSGIDADTEFVIDARGFSAGTEVEVIQK